MPPVHVPRPRFSTLPGGRAVPPISARPGPDLGDHGYVESEWAVEGAATSYREVETPGDGRFVLEPADSADYRTRVLVRRPADPSAFSGVVLVEWLNVSSGQDASPDYTYLAEEIVRSGHAWIGLSAQFVGLHGSSGPSVVLAGDSSRGIVDLSPERYGHLHHPGDAYSYDVFSQVCAWARDADPAGPLGALRPTHVVGVGESQAAFALTSYLDGVHPLVGVVDGFLVHSRAAGRLGFDDRGRSGDLGEMIVTAPALLRDDLHTPVLLVQTEGDLLPPLGYLAARQDDSEWIRVWEIAGSAHADRYLMGDFEAFLGAPDPVNSGQQAFVLRSALRSLVDWVREGTSAPSFPQIDTVDGGVATDEVGNATGGVRTPVVDAPVDLLLGTAREGAPITLQLFGRTLDAPEQVLRARWADRDTYLDTYRVAVDRAIASGAVLADDRDAILADARPHRIEW